MSNSSSLSLRSIPPIPAIPVCILYQETNENPFAPQSFQIYTGITTIGRSTSCQVRVSRHDLSLVHAKLYISIRMKQVYNAANPSKFSPPMNSSSDECEVDLDSITLVDCESDQGTYVFPYASPSPEEGRNALNLKANTANRATKEYCDKLYPNMPRKIIPGQTFACGACLFRLELNKGKCNGNSKELKHSIVDEKHVDSSIIKEVEYSKPPKDLVSKKSPLTSPLVGIPESQLATLDFRDMYIENSQDDVDATQAYDTVVEPHPEAASKQENLTSHNDSSKTLSATESVDTYAIESIDEIQATFIISQPISQPISTATVSILDPIPISPIFKIQTSQPIRKIEFPSSPIPHTPDIVDTQAATMDPDSIETIFAGEYEAKEAATVINENPPSSTNVVNVDPENYAKSPTWDMQTKIEEYPKMESLPKSKATAKTRRKAKSPQSPIQIVESNNHTESHNKGDNTTFSLNSRGRSKASTPPSLTTARSTTAPNGIDLQNQEGNTSTTRRRRKSPTPSDTIVVTDDTQSEESFVVDTNTNSNPKAKRFKSGVAAESTEMENLERPKSSNSLTSKKQSRSRTKIPTTTSTSAATAAINALNILDMEEEAMILASTSSTSKKSARSNSTTPKKSNGKNISTEVVDSRSDNTPRNSKTKSDHSKTKNKNSIEITRQRTAVEDEIEAGDADADADEDIRLLITGVVFDGDKLEKFCRLGHSVVLVSSADMNPTHLVADKVRRTDKFLCTYGKARFILSAAWIERSLKLGKLLAETDFSLKDAEAESKWQFSLATRRTCTNLLSGYKVYRTEHTLTSAFMEPVALAYGGQICRALPATFAEDIVVISNDSDKSEWPNINKLGFDIHSQEFLLTGILQQKIDFHSHLLSPKSALAHILKPASSGSDQDVTPLDVSIVKPARKKRKI